MQIAFDEQKHEYTVDGERMPSVTELVDIITAKQYGEVNEITMKMAAERGSAVHEATQDLDLGFEVSVSPEFFPYVDAYMQFLIDYGPDWDGIEEIVYNPKYGYCGTVDRWGRLDGKAAVLDIKTTSSPNRQNYMAVACQTCLYAWAMSGAYPGEAIKRYALYLKKDGKYRLIDLNEWEEKNDFDAVTVCEHILALYRLTHKKKGDTK